MQKGCAVRVTDADNKELLYRTPLDPVPKWLSAHRTE
jgi:hypothetical protein